MEINESNEQFLGAWTHLAKGAANGCSIDLGGIQAMYSNVPVPFLNVFALNRPVESEADFRSRVQAAREYATKAALPYFLSLNHEWSSPVTNLDAMMAEFGMVPLMNWTGMAADELTMPVNLVSLDVREVRERKERLAVSDINCVSYDMPLEPSREPMCRKELWKNMFGSVLYINDEPVSTASVIVVEDILYVAFVATMPDHRRRGYAEVCMRDALVNASLATGLERTVLHATDAGHPVYKRMGYHDTSKFTLFIEPHEG